MKTLWCSLPNLNSAGQKECVWISIHQSINSKKKKKKLFKVKTCLHSLEWSIVSDLLLSSALASV